VGKVSHEAKGSLIIVDYKWITNLLNTMISGIQMVYKDRFVKMADAFSTKAVKTAAILNGLYK
jgi:hypothetical protein